MDMQSSSRPPASRPASSRPLRHIVILGGGSAGWLCAGVLAAEHQARLGSEVRITLLESPDVAPIGVGEGTWPTMRGTLARIGVSEFDFVRECDASFKQGSLFARWVTGADNDFYFHPFTLPQGYGEANLARRRQERYPDVPYAELVTDQTQLCQQGRAPKQFGTPEYAAVANYGYHLDAGKFGVFLRRHCTELLGVRYLQDHVVSINSHPDGDIASLQTREHGALEADLFVDCSGAQSLLLGQHYQVPFLSQQHVLFNDSALAVQVPYPAPDTPIASQTLSTAQAAGWIWDIGLPTRRGVGHVYSSAHTSDDEALAALHAYLAATGNPGAPPTARKLSFNPGYRARFWHRNVVAIGQSAGFIEPLEASALAMVELSAAMLAEGLPADRAVMDIAAARFNETFTYRWERVIDFLKLHYVLSARRDSAYWRDNQDSASIPARLADLLQLWRTQPPTHYDLGRIQEVFPAASYEYILYGMGYRLDPGTGPRYSDSPARADQFFREANAQAEKKIAALPDNRALIDHMRQRAGNRGR